MRRRKIMSEEITEALLELHYHRAIVDAFASVFGARFLRMLKPSTQRETWVGFDQGWVYTSLPTADLYAALSSTIAAGGRSVEAFYLGYFLQFKVIRALRRRSRYTPPSFAAPYFRSELSVWRNPTTGISQHETLCRLAGVEGALVYYACPLLFDIDRIYEYPDLSTLQVVDVASAPPGIDDQGRHFLAFQDVVAAAPWWCSEAHPAKGRPSSEWIREDSLRPRRRNAGEVLDLIGRATEVLSEEAHALRRAPAEHPSLPQSFTLVSFAA
jgi:hypothetical protein